MNTVIPGMSAPTGALVALVVALLGAVAAALLFLRPRAANAYRGWMRKLSAHVNFDRFLLSSILKFLYVFCVLYAVVTGLISLFSGGVLTGLLWLLLAPVGLRVVFEQALLLLSLRDETRETNDLLRRMQGLPPKSQPVQQPSPQPAARPAASDPRYAQRAGGYAGQPGQPAPGYGGYPPQNRPQQQARPAEYGMTQRYAPIRRDAYGSYENQSQAYPPPPAPIRPTPADGTGRFSALPRREETDKRS